MGRTPLVLALLICLCSCAEPEPPKSSVTYRGRPLEEWLTLAEDTDFNTQMSGQLALIECGASAMEFLAERLEGSNNSIGMYEPTSSIEFIMSHYARKGCNKSIIVAMALTKPLHSRKESSRFLAARILGNVGPGAVCPEGVDWRDEIEKELEQVAQNDKSRMVRLCATNSLEFVRTSLESNP